MLKLLKNHRHLLTEGGWVFSGQIINAFIQLAGIRIVTEYLSADTLGEATMWLGIIVLLKSIAIQPFLNYQIRFYPENLVSHSISSFNKITFKITLKLFYLSSGVFTVVSLVLISFDILKSDQIIILSLVLYFFFDVLKSFFINQLSAERKQRKVAIWTVFESLVIYLLIYIFARAYPSSESYIISMAAGISFGLLLFKGSFAIKKDISKEVEIDKTFLLKGAFQFSGPFLVIALLSWFMNLSSRYFIGFIDNTYQAGLFVAAFSIASRPFTMLSGVITGFLRPILLQAFSQNDFQKIKIISKYWIYSILILGFAMILILFFGSELLSNILLAKEYRQSSSVLFLFIGLGYFALAMFQVFENFLLAEKRTKDILYANILGAIIFTISSLILVQEYSSLGAAISISVSFSIQFLAVFYFYKYKRNL